MLGSPCLAPPENVRTLGDPTLVNDTDPLYLVEILKTKCTDKYVRYIANITFARGIRSIRYTIHDIEPQPAKSVIVRMYWEAGSDKIPVNEGQRQEELMHAAFTASSYFQRSQVYLKERFRYWNAFTIYYAFMSAIESQTSRYCVPLDAELQCDTKSTTSNSSRAVFVPLTCGKGDYTSECTVARSQNTAPHVELTQISHFHTRELETQPLPLSHIWSTRKYKCDNRRQCHGSRSQ
jgi:hypothetical protein